jgi:hypothetical protein
LDAICVSAGKTNQRHPVIVLTNAVHTKRVPIVFWYQCDRHHNLADGESTLDVVRMPSARPLNEA